MLREVAISGLPADGPLRSSYPVDVVPNVKVLVKVKAFLKGKT